MSEESTGDSSSAFEQAQGHPNNLPDDVRSWLEGLLRPDERVDASLCADLLRDGSYGERWAFLTPQRLLVVAPVDGQGAEVELELATDQITGCRIRDFVSSGTLEVTIPEQGLELVRFTRGFRAEAASMCFSLEQIARGNAQNKNGEAAAARQAPPRFDASAGRCPKCGRVLPRRSQTCLNCLQRGKLVVRLFSYIYPYRWLAVVGLAGTLALAALRLVPTYLTKYLIDDVIGGNDLNRLLVVIVALIAVALGTAAIGVGRTYVMQLVGNHLMYDLRTQVFDHLQLLTLSYYNRHQTGHIMARVTSDIVRLQTFIAEGLQDIIVNVVTMVLICGLLFWLDPRLAVIALVPIPLITVGAYWFGRRIHHLYHKIWRRMSRISAVLADTIPGIRVVKSFAQEPRESRRFEASSADLFDQELRATRLGSLFFPSIGFLTSLGSTLVLGLGGYLMLTQPDGRLTLGSLVAFLGYLVQFYQPVTNLGQINHRLQNAATSAERVFEVLDATPEVPEAPGATVLPGIKGEVEFREVRFGYEPGRYALDGVSFHVKPGEMIGLVGPSGAGKSTLVHLICRFYDVDSGAILIDGHDIRELSLRSLREQIGVVLQEPFLFHGTVAANIAYAKPEASPEEIVAAARAANAHDFIMALLDGYDTVIGERGQTMSGGERQRISIARAILRDPCILILDEATASVDTETEVQIQKAIERLVENRTTFAIAHRLSTLRKAHRLIVLEQGELAEIGAHDELIASGGLYSRLCHMQSELSKIRAW
ncbi:MAG TPA: ABC transporter ATP-binding protein [Armatimonadota bacterium]|nr:ABC transporter ATP-binding protein [Armatimonadota bacterium]